VELHTAHYLYIYCAIRNPAAVNSRLQAYFSSIFFPSLPSEVGRLNPAIRSGGVAPAEIEFSAKGENKEVEGKRREIRKGRGGCDGRKREASRPQKFSQVGACGAIPKC